MNKHIYLWVVQGRVNRKWEDIAQDEDYDQAFDKWLNHSSWDNPCEIHARHRVVRRRVQNPEYKEN